MTTIINTQKRANELLNDAENLVIDGDMEAGSDLVIHGSLEVSGSINAAGSILAGRGIEAGGNIEAGWYVKAGWQVQEGLGIAAGGHIKIEGSVESGGNIAAREFIESSRSIRAMGSVVAGTHIAASWGVSSHVDIIECTRLSCCCCDGVLSKLFLAEMKPFAKWKKVLLNTSNYYQDFRRLISTAEAKKICAWDGWHPHHRWHLEMFFGLKQCIEFKNGKEITCLQKIKTQQRRTTSKTHRQKYYTL
jgi:hypothetical protein